MVAPSQKAMALSLSIRGSYPASAAMILGQPYNAGAQVAESKGMPPELRALVQAAALELGAALIAEAQAKQTPAQAEADRIFYESHGYGSAGSWGEAIDRDTDRIRDIKDAYGLDGTAVAKAGGKALTLAAVALALYLAFRR